MRERLREIDLIRALAALSVIAIHVTGAYINSSKPAYYLNITVRYAVPLFILISGIGLYQSENSRKIFSFVTFCTKRLQKILIPYLVWNIIFLIYSKRHDFVTVTSNLPSFFTELWSNIMSGFGSYHLYFILIILQLYLLYPLIRLFAKWNMKLLMSISFIVTLCCQTMVYFNAQNKLVLPNTFMPLFMLFPTWIFFFVFGMYFSENINILRKKISDKNIVTGAVFIIAFIILVLDTKLSQTVGSSVRPSIMLYSTSAFIFFYCIALNFKNSTTLISKVMDFASEQSFFIYFSHVLFLKIIVSASYMIGLGAYWESSRHFISLYFVTVSISMLFAYILSFMPFAMFFGGVYKRRISDMMNKKELPM